MGETIEIHVIHNLSVALKTQKLSLMGYQDILKPLWPYKICRNAWRQLTELKLGAVTIVMFKEKKENGLLAHLKMLCFMSLLATTVNY